MPKTDEDRFAILEKRIADLEQVAKVTPAKLHRASNPCDVCLNHGRYRCYDGPLECPKFYRWAMYGGKRADGR